MTMTLSLVVDVVAAAAVVCVVSFVICGWLLSQGLYATYAAQPPYKSYMRGGPHERRRTHCPLDNE
jgi:hypothetical protein